MVKAQEYRVTTSKRPKLHFFTDCSYVAGSERMLINLATSLAITDLYDVTLSYRYSQHYSDDLAPRIDSEKVNVVPIKGLYPFRAAFKIQSKFARHLVLGIETILLKYPLFAYDVAALVRHFWRLKVDLLHVNNGGYPGAYPCSAAVIAARLCGVRNIVYVVNNLAVSYGNPARWVDRPIDWLVKRWVTQFVTGSRFAADRLCEVLHLPKQRAIAIPNGIRLRAIREERASYLSRASWRTLRPVALIVAQLEKRKGHIYLLEAMRILVESGREAPLLIIEGVGPERAALEQYVETNRLSEHVRFLGSVDHLFDLINAVDFTVLSSIDQEDFPNIILESMALGKAVIGTTVAGIPEQIAHEKTGLLVPPREPNALADALLRLSQNSELRGSLGEQAKEQFTARFTENVAVARYLDLYKSLSVPLRVTPAP